MLDGNRDARADVGNVDHTGADVFVDAATFVRTELQWPLHILDLDMKLQQRLSGPGLYYA